MATEDLETLLKWFELTEKLYNGTLDKEKQNEVRKERETIRKSAQKIMQNELQEDILELLGISLNVPLSFSKNYTYVTLAPRNRIEVSELRTVNAKDLIRLGIKPLYTVRCGLYYKLDEEGKQKLENGLETDEVAAYAWDLGGGFDGKSVMIPENRYPIWGVWEALFHENFHAYCITPKKSRMSELADSGNREAGVINETSATVFARLGIEYALSKRFGNSADLVKQIEDSRNSSKNRDTGFRKHLDEMLNVLRPLLDKGDIESAESYMRSMIPVMSKYKRYRPNTAFFALYAKYSGFTGGESLEPMLEAIYQKLGSKRFGEIVKESVCFDDVRKVYEKL